MKKFEDEVYFKHILDAILQIEIFLGDFTFKEFSKDKRTIGAVIRELAVIGEASNNISKSVQEENPQIPWSKIISMRNFLIHEYFGLDIPTIWKTCQEKLPELKDQIKKILKNDYRFK
jgi:uncharacterized protein with HEPN domain